MMEVCDPICFSTVSFVASISILTSELQNFVNMDPPQKTPVAAPVVNSPAKIEQISSTINEARSGEFSDKSWLINFGSLD